MNSFRMISLSHWQCSHLFPITISYISWIPWIADHSAFWQSAIQHLLLVTMCLNYQNIFGLGVTWREKLKLMVMFDTLIVHQQFQIGDGTRVKFWHDVWCGDNPLSMCFPNLFKINNMIRRLMWPISCSFLMGFFLGLGILARNSWWGIRFFIYFLEFYIWSLIERYWWGLDVLDTC